MGKSRQVLTEVFAWNTPVYSFPYDNFSKCQEILTKLGVCIDIVEIWFGIANEQISSNFDSTYLPETLSYFRFQTITWVKGCQGILNIDIEKI